MNRYKSYSPQHDEVIDEGERSVALPKSRGDAPESMHHLRVATNGLSLLDNTTMHRHKLRHHRRHGQIHGATPPSRRRGRQQRQPLHVYLHIPSCPCAGEAPQEQLRPRGAGSPRREVWQWQLPFLCLLERSLHRSMSMSTAPGRGGEAHCSKVAI